jgi:hypothetical protein
MKSASTELEKTLRDCVVDDKSLAVILTQEETLRFNTKELIEVQLRVLTNGNDALKSDIYTISAGRTLKEGVIQ